MPWSFPCCGATACPRRRRACAAWISLGGIRRSGGYPTGIAKAERKRPRRAAVRLTRHAGETIRGQPLVRADGNARPRRAARRRVAVIFAPETEHRLKEVPDARA